MTIWNLGSINGDLVYTVPHLPVAGETVAATGMARFLGGKGANMAVAAARAAARVCHVGAVGPDGAWAVERLLEYGVDTTHIRTVNEATGHAVIAVDSAGENSILIHPGANRQVPDDAVRHALSAAAAGDWLLMQNETNGQAEAARLARQMGLRVCYVAAPFEAGAAMAILPMSDLLILNEVEAAQLEAVAGQPVDRLGVGHVVITRAARGCRHHDATAGVVTDHPAVPVTAVDSTGAGDTFAGYLCAGLDRGMPIAQSIGQAQLAAALMVTRHGTADVIPDLKDLQDWRLG